MPHHKSAAKRVITNEKARQRNMAAKSHLRSTLRTVRAATTRAEADKALKGAIALLDRTASRGIIKKETASRHKSRLTKFAAKLPA
jgi:small subunit ribosomal protein S20